MKAKAGDEIIVEAQHVGGPKRTGRIIEVLGTEGHEHFRVAWDDGHESIYFPSADAGVRTKDLSRR